MKSSTLCLWVLDAFFRILSICRFSRTFSKATWAGVSFEVAPQLLLLVLLDFPHRFQEFCLVSVLFLLPLGLTKLCDSFELQGSLLDLLVGVHAAHLWIRISKWTKVGGGQVSEMEVGTISFSTVDPRGSLCVG